jgi:hypothetical protein
MWSLAKADLSQSDPSWGYIDESFVGWHLKNGLAAFPFITQAGGYFRRLDQNTLDQLSADHRIRRMFDHQENHERFQRVRRLQEELKLSVSQIVLGSYQPAVPGISANRPEDPARFAGEHKQRGSNNFSSSAFLLGTRQIVQ